MKAFVKTNNGTFPNLNFYLAWEGFNAMGYSVTLFDEKDIPELDVTSATPVFAGVKIFREIVTKLGIDYPDFNCYPDILNSYYGRTLRKSTLGIERNAFHNFGKKVFVKPVIPKQFIGAVWNSTLNLISLANIPDEVSVWVCEPIQIQSEFRVYVYEGEILGVKHYFGDWDIVPDKKIIENAINDYKSSPIAYGIDVGVINKNNCKETIVVEVNDGCNLGNYGLDSLHYGEMIVGRWYEITKKSNLKQELYKEIVMNYGEK